MKRFACLFALALFAAVASAGAQGATDQAVSEMGTLRRPTPKPSGSPGATAKATGPMEFGLYKDAQGKSAATTFGANDPVCLVCKNVTAAKGDKLGVSWFDDKAGKSKKIYQSGNTVPDAGVYNPSFSLAPAKGGTPAGAYHAEFSMNGKAVKSLAFTVK